MFLAMSLYPEVQSKAQHELDSVVGRSRLPALADRPSLPYLNAIVKETLRWHTATPLGVPHLSVADDEYDGMFIPVNSIVMVNAWYVVFRFYSTGTAPGMLTRSTLRSILHDPKMYTEPDAFIPERYLSQDGKPNQDVRDPGSVIFGFGRR